MEERDERSRCGVDGGDVRPLESVALQTGEREVRRVGRPTVLFSNDVIWLVWEERVLLREQTVLAAAIGSFTHLTAKRCVDSRRHGW